MARLPVLKGRALLKAAQAVIGRRRTGRIRLAVDFYDDGRSATTKTARFWIDVAEYRAGGLASARLAWYCGDVWAGRATAIYECEYEA